VGTNCEDPDAMTWRALTLLGVLLTAAAQQAEPPVLPPGQFCQHPMPNGAAPAHPCDCHRECLPNIELGEDGKPHDTVTVKEDPKCKQWCHADHCHCPAMNCE
jgi:hypothetical protein